MQLDQAGTLVVKIGSALVTDAHGAPKGEWIASVAADIAALRHAGTRVVLVCSGAVALGKRHINPKKAKLELREKQAAAACGQPLLMHHWQEALAPHGLTPAQILLTLRDTEQRRSYLNAQNTFSTLLEAGLIPIVNENDTTATSELRYGDNDRLAARVVQLAGASALVLLSDVAGLYTADPRHNSKAQHLPEIRQITPEIEAMADPPQSSVGSGGMVTKIMAAKIATASGGAVAICDGRALNPLARLQAGERATWFLPEETPLTARKRWISGTLAPTGKLIVDAGAAAALQRGNSLLPSGVTAVEGEFSKGETLAIQTADGTLLAKGLSNYDAADAMRLLGRKSADIPEILGYEAPRELIHRDNLVMEPRR